ncbi:hypothetical protein CPB84DRAFT_1781690 [Gymnopilus junonius]|uniref:Uncharacterized protein n=1 Tax=Gymnopilus junonius TaxID=109634 RepID=A0A9P5TMV7_GYMJU|nr:hypothetical protein CPB84DRAFT_1781690 [Gymnopilus junonius]
MQEGYGGGFLLCPDTSTRYIVKTITMILLLEITCSMLTYISPGCTTWSPFPLPSFPE